MALYGFVFSPTGGTRKAAKFLARGLGREVNWQDLSLPDFSFEGTLNPQDLVILAVPSFGGLVPQPALDRILRIHAKGARAVLLGVYGNRAFEDTLVQLEDTAREAGFQVVAAVAALAQHSMVPQLAAGRPDGEDQAQLEAFGKAILAKLDREDFSRPAIPGNRPCKERHPSSPAPLPDGNCNRCGLCAARCPTRAIQPQDPAQVDPALCIGCLRCVALCPQKARHPEPGHLAAITAMLEPFRTLRRENQLFL